MEMLTKPNQNQWYGKNHDFCNFLADSIYQQKCTQTTKNNFLTSMYRCFVIKLKIIHIAVLLSKPPIENNPNIL